MNRLEVRQALDRLESERAEMVIELRLLRDERDPSVIKRHVDEALAKAREESAATHRSQADRIADLEREVRDLRDSKRKLRDALERTKQVHR